VNVGCVPKKVMWNAGQIGHAVHDAADYGFEVTLWRHDWAALKLQRDAFVGRLNEIYERNLERRKVDLLRGHARLGNGAVGPGGRTGDLGRRDRAGRRRPGDDPAIAGTTLGITSDGFFELSERPARVAVVGAGMWPPNSAAYSPHWDPRPPCYCGASGSCGISTPCWAKP